MLDKRCTSIGQILDINIKLYNQKNSLIFEHNSLVPPDYLLELMLKDCEKILDEIKINENEYRIVTNSIGLNYCLIKFSDNNILIGPFFLENHYIDSKKSLENMRLSKDDLEQCYKYLDYLNLFDNEKIESIVSMIYAMIHSPIPNIRTIKTEKIEQDEYIIDLDDESFYTFVDENYRVESIVLYYIKTGNIYGLKDLFSKHEFQMKVPTRQQFNQLRNKKNLAITLNSISVRAAFQGGISPQLSHKISTKYAIMIENAKSDNDLDGLFSDLIFEYANAVKDYNIGHYSHHIQHTIQYIEQNLSKKITISDISDTLHISKEHLQRLFKKEVNTTISNYIMKRRIDQAKEFIEKDYYSITYISELLQFSNPSHFTKSFKQYVGLTPKQYKEKHLKKM